MDEVIDNKEHSEEKQNSSDTQNDSARKVRRAKAIARFRPEYVEMLRDHMQENSFFSFGGVVRESGATLYLWLAAFPEFKRVREEFKTQIGPGSIYNRAIKCQGGSDEKADMD